MTQSNTVYLKDYQPHPFKITSTTLSFELDAKRTIVYAQHTVVAQQKPAPNTLTLDCEAIDILDIIINGETLSPEQYRIEHHSLHIDLAGKTTFQLDITNTVAPDKNTQLSGLYQSKDMLCTQCEAEGFRRITPTIDRPDNLAIYQVKLIADKTDYPVLLSNGNLIDSGTLGDDKHFTLWQDPFPKPTYLFALVAGQLNHYRDVFTTASGKKVTLCFYARGNDNDYCHYALESLKRAMAWDEQTYGREYDLDIYNVVAVDDFNMGAMENKSLNIFNTKYILADAKEATDRDFFNVESVIAHEYFHNWSGNRVTCRDWFQLSLKEGFTVFRDQEFSADLNHRDVVRIDDVNVLRTHQFKEDNGPLAHPVRPESYQAIDNFYTVTIYNKGAEVVRMLRHLLGPDDFRKATDLYFDTFDGQAATIEDFVSCMTSISGKDLSAFKRWYSQSGTPRLNITQSFDPKSQRCTITLEQHLLQTPGQPDKQPFVIPVKVAAFDKNGKKLPLFDHQSETTWVIDQPKHIITLDNIDNPPILSVLREFSAPVIINYTQSDAELAVLAAYDDDGFNRWEACQKTYLQAILKRYDENVTEPTGKVPEILAKTYERIILDGPDNPAIVARLLSLPSHKYISEQINPLDPVRLHYVRRAFTHDLVSSQYHALCSLYQHCQKNDPQSLSSKNVGLRALRDQCLSLLAVTQKPEIEQLAEHQYLEAQTMTDINSAFMVIAESSLPDKQQHIDNFYQTWQHRPLVIDKWLSCQAMVESIDNVANVKQLTQHPAFDADNPNRVYALIGAFASANPLAFHHKQAGYRFLQQWITTIDAKNPQLSARLCTPLTNWRQFETEYAIAMRAVIDKLLSLDQLSKNTREILSKSIQQ